MLKSEPERSERLKVRWPLLHDGRGFGFATDVATTICENSGVRAPSESTTSEGRRCAIGLAEGMLTGVKLVGKRGGEMTLERGSKSVQRVALSDSAPSPSSSASRKGPGLAGGGVVRVGVGGGKT